MNLFRLHGLVVACDVPLVGVVPLQSGKADVAIKSAELSNDWEWSGQSSDHWIHVSPDHKRVRVDVPDVAVFLITDGHTIEYAKAKACPHGAFQSFLLGRVFAAVLYQRHQFPLHGSAVEIGGRAVILLGDRGAGKSTLAASLVSEGCNLVSDDVSTLDPETLRVSSGVQRSKLWSDSLDHFGVTVDGLTQVDLQNGKFFLNSTGLSDLDIPVGCIVELADGALDISTVSLTNSLRLLREHNFEFDFVRALGLGQEFMNWAGAVVQDVPVYRLTYPRDFSALEQVRSSLKSLALDGAQ